jgi:hypothetical protein
MNAVIADKEKRLRLRVVEPGDVYFPETLTRDKIVLLRIEPPKPKRKMTREEVLKAIDASPLMFEVGYDELRKLTREP